MRGPQRHDKYDMLWDRVERYTVLTEDWKISPIDITHAVRENSRTKMGRRRTLCNLKKQKVNVFLESARRKLKRAVLFQKRTSSRVEDLMKQAEQAAVLVAVIPAAKTVVDKRLWENDGSSETAATNEDSIDIVAANNSLRVEDLMKQAEQAAVLMTVIPAAKTLVDKRLWENDDSSETAATKKDSIDIVAANNSLRVENLMKQAEQAAVLVAAKTLVDKRLWENDGSSETAASKEDSIDIAAVNHVIADPA